MKRDLVKMSKQMRIDAINLTYNAKSTGAHIGGTLSMIEIMSVLYGEILNFDFKNPYDEYRDRFILSKGHGVIAQYVAMKECGYISKEILETFKSNETKLYAHPSMDSIPGIECSSGSLGQGLSFAVGISLALKRKKNQNSKVYVLVGDGECDEGQIWEAANTASKFICDNLTVIVDYNKLQYDGPVSTANARELGKRWESFGWETIVVDGHNVNSLLEAFNEENDGKPKVIIANTIKGKGVSFMENNPQWHNGRLSEKQYSQAIMELEA